MSERRGSTSRLSSASSLDETEKGALEPSLGPPPPHSLSESALHVVARRSEPSDFTRSERKVDVLLTLIEEFEDYIADCIGEAEEMERRVKELENLDIPCTRLIRSLSSAIATDNSNEYEKKYRERMNAAIQRAKESPNPSIATSSSTDLISSKGDLKHPSPPANEVDKSMFDRFLIAIQKF